MSYVEAPNSTWCVKFTGGSEVGGIFGIHVRVRPLSHASLPESERERRGSEIFPSLILTFKVSFFRHHQHLPRQLREIDNHGGNGDVGR